MKMNTVMAMQNQKSNGVTVLLFLFLGFFGIHRFYAQGCTVFNVLYLCTCGFFGIMILVDLFLVWGMASKANTDRIMNAQMMDQAMS